MEGHRQRLIESGLLVPLSKEEIARRNGIMVQIAERKARGEKVRSGDIPNCCVFRSDDHRNHVLLLGNRCCQDAELIADKLYSYEASRICHHLGLNDPEQPPRSLKGLSPFEMYKWCTRPEWDEWVEQRSRTTE